MSFTSSSKLKILIILVIALSCIVSCTGYKNPAKLNDQTPKYKSLVIYKTDNIKGYLGKPIIVDYSFIPVLRRVDYYARKYNVILQVTSSFRTPKQQSGLSGTVVKPASMSNHLAGHAIDMNIVYNGNWYDSRLMRKGNFHNLPYNVREFINSIRKDKYMRWGGDFSDEDPVHIDDHLNRNKTLWSQRYKVCQQAYLNYLKNK
jgi:hypothetical protein